MGQKKFSILYLYYATASSSHLNAAGQLNYPYNYLTNESINCIEFGIGKCMDEERSVLI